MINRILACEISLETALFIVLLFIILFGFLQIIFYVFTLWKQAKRKDVPEEMSIKTPEQQPKDKDVFANLEKDFYAKPSNGLRAVAAALFGISLLLFIGLFPVMMGSHSRYQSSHEMPSGLKYFAGFIFSATAIVFACLWRKEYTFTENRNIRTAENVTSRLLRFFLHNRTASCLLSLVLIFTAYDLIIFNITDNGFIITALLIYAFIFFLLAIVKKSPFHS